MSDADQNWTLPFCPRPPAWELDWKAIENAYPWVRAMLGCPQDPRFHAEGDVLTHTRLVCEALAGSDAWRNLAPEAQAIVFAATLMHDVAKPRTTRSEGNRITARGHARRGAQRMRAALYRGDDALPPPPLETREQIAALIRRHGVPLYAFDSEEPAREVILASQTARCDWLALLAWADVAGRECADRAGLFERVEFFRELSREQQCLDRPFAFLSPHSRFLYFRTPGADPRRLAFDDCKTEVVLLAGLPGAGKDTYIEHYLADRTVISLDALRRQLRIAPDKDQGAVAAKARAIARELLRDGKPFVWNATNTTRAMRDSLIAFFRRYGARVRIVYVETAWRELLHRNRQRQAPVPRQVLERLVDRLEPPDPTEAHDVTWMVSP